MNKSGYRFTVSIATVLVFALLLAHQTMKAQSERIRVVWYVGLGAGRPNDVIEVGSKIVEAFNSSQDEIELNLYMHPSSATPLQNINELVTAGYAPDIVGPMNINTTQLFPDQWLDLEPLARKYNYDLSQFPKPVLDLHREGGKLIGLPFSVLPSLMYYNVDLFDASGLNYPPAEFGQKYILDGKEVEWNWDTVAEIGRRLTLDIHGNNANSPDFDASNIVQFGFMHEWDDMRSIFSAFGGASVVNANGKVEIPEHWREAARWLYTGLWKDKFIPTNQVIETTLRSSSPFVSGKVALMRTMLWYTYYTNNSYPSISDIRFRWDIGAMPSYKGQVYVPADGATFFIHRDSRNPDAAFRVLEYLHGVAAGDLLEVNLGFPARPELHQRMFNFWAKNYPNVKNWHILTSSLKYGIDPPYSLGYPNSEQGRWRFREFQDLLYGNKDIDLEQELDRLESDLQRIIEAPPTATPLWGLVTPEADAN